MNDVSYDPDAGGVGYLTWDQWDRLTRAWQTAHKHLGWWWVAGHIRGGDSDELRVRRKDRPLGLPATWLAAYEITRLMNELNAWPELEDAANDKFGQYIALTLIGEVETAAAQWPIEDRPHRVKFFRCPACNQQALRYHPPSIRGSEVRDMEVRCTNHECRAVLGHEWYEFAERVVADEQRRLDQRARRAREGGEITGDGVPVAEVGADQDVETRQDSAAVLAGSVEV